MKIESIHLKHIGHFSDLLVRFNTENTAMTLISGDHGAGKTLIMKHLYQALSWFPARYRDLRTAGVVIADQDILLNRLQAKVDIQVQIPVEVGYLPESSSQQTIQTSICDWQLYKTITSNGTGLSKVETLQLERLVKMYQHAQKQDSLQGLPLIAYYPSDRFIHEVNLLSKNTPAVFQTSHAYDNTAIPFCTFTRFFEWIREVSDTENAQTAQLLHQWLDSQDLSNPKSQTLWQAHAQLHAPALQALRDALRTVLPEVSNLYVQYQPALQLMVCYQSKTMQFSQLPGSIKSWTALVGDIVRRMCLLNPLSLYPCMEGEGVLLIDAIDQQLDLHSSQHIMQRLHQAFPRLQIIASTSQYERMDDSTEIQHLQLSNQQIQDIQPQQWNSEFEQIYEQLCSTDNTDTLQQSAEQMWQQIQQSMNPEEQLKLLQLMQNPDGSNSFNPLS